MTTRRDFLRQSGAAVAAGLILPETIWAKTATTRVSANDQLNVALIGCRGMGWYNLEDTMNHPGLNCIGLCDIDQRILNSRAADAEKKWGKRPELYGDYRRLLERKDLDAVIIGTPDHWHCLMMTDACSSGKDVYVEKPIANSIAECDAMVKAAQRYGRVVQVGQQQRSSHMWRRMKEYIDSGRLGTISQVNIWANFSYAAILRPVPDAVPPQEVDFDMWLGPAPKRTFNENRFHGSWRMFWDYGGGLMTDWGVHLLDMALWGMNVTDMPRRVMGSGGNFAFPENIAETFDTLNVIYEFDKFNIRWSNTTIESGPYGMNYGLEFKGTNGTLIVNRERMEVIPQNGKTEPLTDKPSNNEHYDHTTDFINCIKSRNTDTACPITNGSLCAKYAQIGNIAARTGESLTYNDREKTFNSKAANKFITPEYRKPWRLPKF